MSTPTILKDQFRNDSPGVIGAVSVNNRGEVQGIPVYPGDTVWLSDEEQVLTANSPRDPADNPLINGSFTLIAEQGEFKNARPVRPVAETPPEGERPADEEVGTPDAAPADAPPPAEQPEPPAEPPTVVAADGRTVVEKTPDQPQPQAPRRRASADK